MNMPATVAADDAAPMPATFLVERETLMGPLDYLARVVARRNCIPILDNVVIQPTEDGQLRLSATDLDLHAAFVIEAAWEAPGGFTVPACALRDVIRKMPKGSQVTFSHDPGVKAGKLLVTAGRVRTTLATLPVDDAPVIAFKDEEARSCSLPAAMLARDLAALSPAMSKEEARYYLNGIAIQERAGDLVMIATDGGQMAYVTRDAPEGLEALSTILPSRAVAMLVRRLNTKGLEPFDVLCEFIGDSRARFTGPGFALTTKMIDGTFPDWGRARELALGEGELQKVAMIEMHPSLHVAKIAAMAKAAGADLDAYTGEKAALLCSPAYPEYRAVTMFTREGDADKNYGFNRYHSAAEHAVRYAAALAEADGLTPHATRSATYVDGLITAVTFGEWETVQPEPVEHVCYETLTTRMEYPDAYRVYQDGAFSIAIPRSHGALVTVAMDGDDAGAQPVRTNEKGELQLSEAAVRALAGDVADLARVDIPRLQFLHGEIVRDMVIPGPPMIATGKRGRLKPMSDRDQLAAYCADPRGFMDRIRARPMETVIEPEPAPVDVPAIAPPIAVAAELPDAPAVDEGNVIHVDFQPEPVAAAPAVDMREEGEDMREAAPVADIEPQNMRADLPEPQPGASEMEALRAENEGLRALLVRMEARLAVLESGAPAASEPDPVVIEATFDAYGRSYSTPVIAGFNVQPDQAERVAELEAELAASREAVAATAAANERLAGDLGEARERAEQYLGEAQVNAERAVAAEIALRVAEGKLERFAPLIAAAASLPPMPMIDTGDGLRVAAAL